MHSIKNDKISKVQKFNFAGYEKLLTEIIDTTHNDNEILARLRA